MDETAGSDFADKVTTFWEGLDEDERSAFVAMVTGGDDEVSGFRAPKSIVGDVIPSGNIAIKDLIGRFNQAETLASSFAQEEVPRR